MGRATVTERRLDWDRTISNFRSLKGRGVKIGFLGGDVHAGGATMATIAAVHEEGVEMVVTERQAGKMRSLGMGSVKPGYVLRIPARPVIRQAVDGCERDASRRGAAHFAAHAADPKAADNALAIVGEVAQSAVKAGYVNAREHVEPLSDITIAQRRLRSVGSDAPLVDTGALVGAVRYEVQ